MDTKIKKTPTWLKILLIVLGILVIIGIFGAVMGDDETNDSNNKSNTKNSVKTEKKEKFSYNVESAAPDENNFFYYISGTVTNNTNKDYSYVQIEFVCYDSQGNNLGTALDNTNNLLGNQTWKYKATFLGSEVEEIDHCDYHEITNW